MTKLLHLASIALVLLAFQSTAANAAAGRTQGSFAVSNSGAATYSIPIWSPPGVKGIEPHIALVYNSQQGDGSVGVGWSLAGLSSIYRCNRTVAQDSNASGIALTSNDALCMDGNRLRLFSGSYGTQGSIYRTEIETFSRITAIGSAGGGPASFVVEGKDGLIYSYGATNDSQVLATNTSTASSWLLNEVRDRSGNRMIIGYSQSGGYAVPSFIKWTFNDAQSLNAHYKMSFGYSTKPPQGLIHGYIAGTTVDNGSQLDSISILADDVSYLRNYRLGYEQSPTTGRVRLHQVTECADASNPGDCLQPTTIGYQNGSAGVNAGIGVPVSGLMQFDFDGDNYMDIAYPPDEVSNWHIRFGSPNGFVVDKETAFNFSSAFPIDLKGDGKGGFLELANGTPVAYHTLVGTDFVPQPISIPNEHIATTADVNGDGLPDLVTWTDDGNTYRAFVHLNTSSGSAISFDATGIQMFQSGSFLTLGIFPTFETASSGCCGSIKKVDFDGDGREDILMTTLDWCGIEGCGPAFVTVRILMFNGTNFSANILPAVGGFGVGVQFANLNNDNCTDVIVGTRPYISNCAGSVGLSPDLPTTGVYAVLDWDGDGKEDVLVSNGSALDLYTSNGIGFSGPIATSLPFDLSGSCVTIDADFDGLDDLVCGVPGQTITLFQHNGAAVKPDLLTSVTDGFGINFSPVHVPITHDAYAKNPYSNPSYPYRENTTPFYVTKRVVATDPSVPSGTFYQDYKYFGAWRNVQGRGFNNFFFYKKYDSRNTLWEAIGHDAIFPMTGLFTFDQLSFDEAGTQVIRLDSRPEGSKTLDSAANNQRYFVFSSDVNIYSYEATGPKKGQLITTNSTHYNYDDYGNATTILTTITDSDSTSPASPYSGQQWTSTTTTTVTPDSGANWCLGLPTNITVTNTAPNLLGLSNVTPITRTVSFPSPNYATCRAEHRVIEPNSSVYAVAEDYHFDGFGNVDTVTVTAAGVVGNRITQINWGGRGQFPMSVTNPLNESTVYDYDFNFGLMRSLKDPNSTQSNNIETTWHFDAFGRVDRKTRADGTFTVFVYDDCANLGGCVIGQHGIRLLRGFYNKDNSGLHDDFLYFDSMDRPLATGTRNLAGGYDRSDVRYDSLGRVSQRSMPCAWVSASISCQFWNNYSYDSLDRITDESRLTKENSTTYQTTHTDYKGLTIVATDAQNKVATKVASAVGAIVQSQDHNGYYQKFVYDAFGSLVNVSDSLSNTLQSNTFAYGIGAFKIGRTDMDMGSWGYTINGLGEVKAYTDANGASFILDYDALSRIHTRTVAGEGTTTWNWGNSAASFNIGKIQSISQTGGPTETYNYDNRGRLSNRHIVSDASYDYDYAYDDTVTGLLDTVTFPTSTAGYRLKLKYGYQNGILNQVKDFNSSTVFWALNAANARGQITQETIGNVLVTNRVFDAVTGWLSSIQCGIGGGTCTQNQSYLYDLVGNLTQRQNNNLFLTETFCYDDVYRLDHSTLTGSCAGAANLSMHYDAMGNITSRDDIAGGAAWTYHPTHKHQVMQAGDASHTYSYDSNGNAITRNGLGITWSKYNYPTVINGNGESASLYYDANNMRWKQVYTQGSTTETTIYVGNKLEKVTANGVTDYRHYIFANEQAVAIVSRTTGGLNTTHYLLRDVLGSASKITDSAGSEVVSESFTPFGARRNPLTWSGMPTNGDQVAINGVTREGFTGHDLLGNLGLNHMNGRIEDAVTGRFLSADPHVTFPGNTQSFNRYSYVNNNPLSFVDPSGFDADGSMCAGEGVAAGSSDDRCVTVTGSRPPPDPVNANVFGPSQGGFGGTNSPTNSTFTPTAPQALASVAPMPTIVVLGSRLHPAVVATAAVTLGASLLIVTNSHMMESFRRPNYMEDPRGKFVPPKGQTMAGASESTGADPNQVDPDDGGDGDEFPSIEELVVSAERPIAANGLSRAAQSLSSHAQRVGGTFPVPRGNVAQQNAQASRMVRSILEDPNSKWTRLTRNGFEVRLPSGQGVRFNFGNVFDGFLDPYKPPEP